MLHWTRYGFGFMFIYLCILNLFVQRWVDSEFYVDFILIGRGGMMSKIPAQQAKLIDLL